MVLSPSRPLQIGWALPRMTSAKCLTWLARGSLRSHALDRGDERLLPGPITREDIQAQSENRQRTLRSGNVIRVVVGIAGETDVVQGGQLPTAPGAAVSESRNVPSALLAKRKTIAAVTSTGNPRVEFDVNAITVSMSPISDSRMFTSWVRLSRMGPPPGCASPTVANVERVVGFVEQGACLIRRQEFPGRRFRRSHGPWPRWGRSCEGCPVSTGTSAFSTATRRRVTDTTLSPMGCTTITSTSAATRFRAADDMHTVRRGRDEDVRLVPCEQLGQGTQIAAAHRR